MVELTAQSIKDIQDEKRTFKEDTAFGILQDRIAELELRINELESKEELAK